MTMRDPHGKRQYGLMQQSKRARGLLQHEFMDFADLPRTSEGHAYLLLMVDQLTDIVLLKPFKSKSSRRVKHFLQKEPKMYTVDQDKVLDCGRSEILPAAKAVRWIRLQLTTTKAMGQRRQS
ncbi:hypothetical protein SARC_04866 [Sphaeroforma arctica JP610]|uniref:Uncharacterized protein n=1 Tax=Sphaeroforma arctica JP610 TaxID=667725 RepID=A0A0L0G152_9EUKA|nr:hypothetical protein SARC_04866 [Sphaeroforma arctica JP610]KNC82867.1 hypothetical protein SARC_04866 [Sphaeroforma arctica JP610]|eukprot:XP_014156769.1 hypothetical protein SARC_04866 [Sphaeroforma arctica JP610]